MLFFHDGNHLAASPMSRQWGDLAKYGVSVVEGVPPLLEQFERISPFCTSSHTPSHTASPRPLVGHFSAYSMLLMAK